MGPQGFLTFLRCDDDDEDDEDDDGGHRRITFRVIVRSPGAQYSEIITFIYIYIYKYVYIDTYFAGGIKISGWAPSRFSREVSKLASTPLEPSSGDTMWIPCPHGVNVSKTRKLFKSIQNYILREVSKFQYVSVRRAIEFLIGFFCFTMQTSKQKTSKSFPEVLALFCGRYQNPVKKKPRKMVRFQLVQRSLADMNLLLYVDIFIYI